MKIQKNSSPVSPFSGIAFVNNEFDKSGLSQLVDKELGKSKFQDSDDEEKADDRPVRKVPAAKKPKASEDDEAA
jgi:hypothetical protein